MHKFILTICAASAFLLVSTATEAEMIFVPSEQPTIQAAVEVANDGDTVLISPGSHAESVSVIGKDITIASHYILSSDSVDINNTRITTHDSFSFQGCSGSTSLEGLHFDNTDCLNSTISIFQCRLKHISSSNSTLHLSYSVIAGGVSIPGGGGLYAYASEVNISSCIFYDNEAYGEDVWCGWDEFTMEDIYVPGPSRGGAILSDRTTLSIANCTFAYNQAYELCDHRGSCGGAIAAYSTPADSMTIENSIFYENTADGEYGSIL